MKESQSAPIVLVHGILGFSQLTAGGLKLAEYFRQVPDALRADGHFVPMPPRLNPAGSIAERAHDLKHYLDQNAEAQGRRVHLVAHSMGGLDARFMIAHLEMAGRVLSLTTIGTPHHGSPIADIVESGTNPALNQFMKHLGVDTKAVPDLTTDACRRFNLETPDAPEVRYFSIAGKFEPPRILTAPQGLLGLTHDIVAKTEQANDGVVSVASATLAERGAWTSLDVWDVNHFRLINWGNNLLPSLHELSDDSIIVRYQSLVRRVKELTVS
jgi:triacylglycerol lipase